MKRALIDLSSVVWTCLMAGKDREYGIEVKTEAGKAVWVNSADYGYDNALNHLRTVAEDLKIPPRQMIFVVEGQNSKLGRQQVMDTYKSSRKDVPELYDRFNEIKRRILDLYLKLGAQSVTQPNVESDDIIGYLVKKLHGERWIVSADKDLAQCVGGDVHHYRMGICDENPFGPFPHELIPVCIALVGDASDKIPGAKGFGEKSFLDLLTVFGDDGLRALKILIETRDLDKLAEDVGELKILQKVIDHADDVYKSYELGKLWTDKVDTIRRPLEWKAGMVRPRGEIAENQFRLHGGYSFLVTKENFDESLSFFEKNVKFSPEVTLDIETSTPPESDEWIESLGKAEGKAPVDVFGSTLTGMGITFGWNMQYTVYLTVDHEQVPGFTNITKAQVAEFLKLIPKQKEIVVHNAAFELPICYMELAELLGTDDKWHGFLPNVIDSRIMSSYVDENRSAGLKSLSKEVLGYEQETYQEVTTIEMPKAHYKGIGKIVAEWQNPGDDMDAAKDEDYEGVPMVRVQHKMNELTAQRVFSYGADDPICTSALSNHFRILMEIEGSWGVFKDVEQLPAYLTAKAFVDGVDFSRETMGKMEKEDDVAYDAAWHTLREYLIKIGFEGVNPPVFDEMTPANIKEAFQAATGVELKTMVRTPSKLAKLIYEAAETNPALADRMNLIGTAVENNDLGMLNHLVATWHSGEPQLDLASPKQMAHLLYDIMGLPINIINDVTATEKEKIPGLDDAVRRFKRRRAGHTDVKLDDEDLTLIRRKAKSDDTAIDYALAFDTEFIDDEARAALKAIGVMKKVMTRRSLFYKTYWKIPHWKDGKIHAQLNQSVAVTRRYSSSGPNLQQLPKKGEGVKFRSCFQPHHKYAVIGSIDFSGQELRLGAERSQDKNMLACYVGDKLKDIHSITAAGAMKLKWGVAAVKQLFEEFGQDLYGTIDADYELFIRLRKFGKAKPIGKKADDLRKDSKNVNFAAQFGGKAAKLSETLIMKLEDAQLFLDARSAMFPDVDKAAARAEAFCKRYGYAETMLGVRRHLRESIMSDDKFLASRAARQAWNMEIQGSAAEMVKLAMARFWASGVLFRYDVRFIAPIHDELVISVHRDHAVEVLKILHDCMTAPYAKMKVPILGSISVGRDFANQIECGDWFIKENIEAGLWVAFNGYPELSDEADKAGMELLPYVYRHKMQAANDTSLVEAA